MEIRVQSGPSTGLSWVVQFRLKGAIDVAGAGVGLILLSPLLLLLVFVVRLGSSGPIFYRRRVAGLTGKEFDALKFRTMVVNADEVLRGDPRLLAEYQRNVKLTNDPRVTSVGRWLRRLSLDELPQLLNVLRGEMSLVGPRIIAPDELHKYGGFATKRLSVKPGITGLWQVSGRQDVSYDTRVQLDMEYIDKWSLWLDIKILIKTAIAVIAMRGAY